jgi:hypothetical protein
VKSPSQRARDLRAKHPELSLAQLGERVGLSKQGVAQALRAQARRGRPPLGQDERIARLEAELAAARAR